MNLKHLFYFWKTARSGGVVKRARPCTSSPQTISGQIRLLEESLDTQLFSVMAARWNSPGRTVGDGIRRRDVLLGAETEQALRHYPKGRPAEFRVGCPTRCPVTGVPAVAPGVNPADPVRIICREWRLDRRWRSWPFTAWIW